MSASSLENQLIHRFCNDKNEKRTHILLQRVAIDPKYQGKGIGTWMMKQVLAEVDKENMPCALGTQRTSNIEWYKKLGFVVVDELKNDPNDAQSPSLWFMTRKNES